MKQTLFTVILVLSLSSANLIQAQSTPTFSISNSSPCVIALFVYAHGSSPNPCAEEWKINNGMFIPANMPLTTYTSSNLTNGMWNWNPSFGSYNWIDAWALEGGLYLGAGCSAGVNLRVGEASCGFSHKSTMVIGCTNQSASCPIGTSVSFDWIMNPTSGDCVLEIQ